MGGGILSFPPFLRGSMKRFIFLLLASCAFTPLPQQTIDPQVQQVLTSLWYKPTGESFRVILRNTDEDQCLQMETIGIKTVPAQITSQKKICRFLYKERNYSLQESQEVVFLSPHWEKNFFKFYLSYMPAGSQAPILYLRCEIDVQADIETVQCQEAKVVGS